MVVGLFRGRLMSQILINAYLSELDRIKRISGSLSEQVIREAFKDLLKACDLPPGSSLAVM